MITPNNRKEFERHIDILAESIERKTFQLPPSRRILRGLLSAKQLPNKRISFLTIDESTRLLANSLANFDRPEFKNRKNAR
ncbi:hypothetical protein LAG90_02720 [Marinilongibacter aquaticus]|uniref:AVAST type 1 anti-phage system protein Avs1c n=1 Tax=Autumnicola tepida TaxID=3075595 RepID=A0ABU3C5N0_9FLAO|nr:MULTISPECIES: AVAST type 1 anti-phage system protein Avs1c [Bacteroidota]MDT0641624.1 AVAST type 1 anti-phage system protein Avs1c [Zunongwangia sp. F363]UBM59568.1 hypothetical protein LAG90_02720 [Marinilongibacter aquaticus]